MTINTEMASPLAFRDLLDIPGVAEDLATDLLRLSASWVGRLYEMDAEATRLVANPTRQEALAAQLKVLKAMADLMEPMQDKVLDDGKSEGISNPKLAEPLRLSGERVRQRLAARANRFGK